MFIHQQTLKHEIHCSGVGLHCGKKVAMTLRPTAPGIGIVFRRSDLPGLPEVQASWRYAVETPLCTTLMNDNTRVATVEHLLAALLGCGIDNLLIDLDGPEVPAMDGSAAPFVFLIECAGIVEQNSPRKALRILKRTEVVEPHRAVSLTPDERFTVSFIIDFENTRVGHQSFESEIDSEIFKRDIARARTFGFLEEVDEMRAAGLARGGSLDNAIVIEGDTILNDGGLRYEDEFVRHKTLDSIGDLYLAGGPLLGHFEGLRASHAIALRLLKKLFADESAWEWVALTDQGFSRQVAGASVPPPRAVAQSA